MSVKQMSIVWEHEFTPPEQAVMLALADHAHDDGTNIRPSVARTAWKTGYSDRQVQRILKHLRDDKKILVLTRRGDGRGNANEYRFDWTKGVKKSPFQSTKRVTSEQVKGDITVSPEPSVIEPSVKNPLGNPDGLPPCSDKNKKKIDKPHFQSPTQEEYRERVDEILAKDDLGNELHSLIQLAASENVTGHMRASRAWNEFVLPFVQKREDFSDEEWRAGFARAIKAGAGNLNYVTKVARKHQMSTGAEVIGFQSPKSKASPKCVVQAFRDHAVLSRYVNVALDWDFTQQVNPEGRNYMRMGGDDYERSTNIDRAKSVARRAMKKEEVG